MPTDGPETAGISFSAATETGSCDGKARVPVSRNDRRRRAHAHTPKGTYRPADSHAIPCGALRRVAGASALVPAWLASGTALAAETAAVFPSFGVTDVIQHSIFTGMLGAAIAWALAHSLMGPAPAAYATEVSPKRGRAVALSAYRTFGDVGLLVGPVALGALADCVGVGPALAANGGGVPAPTCGTGAIAGAGGGSGASAGAHGGQMNLASSPLTLTDVWVDDSTPRVHEASGVAVRGSSLRTSLS